MKPLCPKQVLPCLDILRRFNSSLWLVPLIKEVVQPPESVVLVESDSESESVLMVVVPLIKENFRPSEYVVLVESDSKSESASDDVETTQEESADNSPPSKVVR